MQRMQCSLFLSHLTRPPRTASSHNSLVNERLQAGPWGHVRAVIEQAGVRYEEGGGSDVLDEGEVLKHAAIVCVTASTERGTDMNPSINVGGKRQKYS